MRNLFLALAVASTLGACKEKPPAAGTGSGAGSAAAATTQPTGSGSAAPAIAARTPGTKLSASELVEISRIKFDGFRNSSIAVTADKAQLRQYRDRQGNNVAIFATVTVNPCVDCTPMELPKWEAKADALKAITLDAEIRDKSTYTLGEATIAGKKMISGYQLGQVEQTYTHAAQLWFNDGTNEIWIIVQYGDNPTKDAETMAQLFSRERLQDIAAMMMSEYLKRM